MGRRWDTSSVMIIAFDAVLWIVGILLFEGVAGEGGEATGELLTIIAATLAVIFWFRAWQLRMHRAFVHGYHSGWHDASKKACIPESHAECEVLEFSELRARKMSTMA